ncbi:hypothetical protein AKJ65_02950, partial [candidate division MSBL1 archaeon SCGC-AAA259E19]
MNKKFLVIFVVSTLFASIVLPSSAPEATAQQGRVKRESTFGNWTTEAWNNFNPVIMDKRALTDAIYETLGAQSLLGGFEPVLAKGWEYIDNYTFEIRIYPEATFWDGSEVTSEDVVFSLKSQGKRKYTGPLVTTFDKYIKSIEAVDEKTVYIHLNENYPRNRKLLSSLLLANVFPKERWSKLLEEYGENITAYKNDDFEEINGSGPYKPVSALPEKVVMEQVDDYWGSKIGRHYLPEFWRYQKAMKAGNRFNLFREGSIDIVSGWVPKSIGYTEKRPQKFGCWNEKAKIRKKRYHFTESIWWAVPNYKKLNLVANNTWLRKALAYAVDMEEMSKKIKLGTGAPFPPSIIDPLSSISKQYINKEVIRNNFETSTFQGIPVIKHDPQKAIQILQEHCEGSVEEGWTYNGEKIGPYTINTVNGWVDIMSTCRMVARYWEEIGIKTEVEFPNYGLWSDKFKNFRFEWTIMPNAGIRPLSPLTSLWQFLAPHVGTWGGGRSNYYSWFPEKGEKAFSLLSKAYSYPIGSEKSIELVKQMQELYVPDLPVIPCWETVRHTQWYTTRWVNWATKDDPYPMYYWPYAQGAWQPLIGKKLYPEAVKTQTAFVNPKKVKAGEKATVSVILRNTGDVKHDYETNVRLGPAEAGPGPEVIAEKVVTLDPGEERTVEIPVTIENSGEYTLTVDDWRFGRTDSNPGEPIEKTLIVTKAGKAMISPSTLTLSKAEVEPGESTTVSVDVSNEGSAKGSKTIEITLGGETIKSETVTLEPGETTTVSATISKSAEGTYTVKAGNLTRTFTVKKREVVIPPGLEDKVTLAIRMAENARSAAVGARSSAQEAVTTAQEAKSAAESAESAATSAQSAA